MSRSLLVLPFLATATLAEDNKAWGARLDLISEQAVIAPGQPFDVGIRIHHRQGFHSYWKHPGLVGFATKIDWKLPDGFTAGPLVWPTPELVDMAGHTAHGYHRDVLLTATVTPPEELPQKEVTLRARIAWMACSDACHPGDKPFSITLPVGPEPELNPDTAPLFTQARDEQPGPLAGWKVKLLSQTNSPGIVLGFTATDIDAPVLTDPYFFSSDGQVTEGRPTITTRKDGVMLFTFERAEHGPKNAAGLPGLIAYGPESARQFGSIAP